jgi:hypothetical protein
MKRSISILFTLLALTFAGVCAAALPALSVPLIAGGLFSAKILPGAVTIAGGFIVGTPITFNGTEAKEAILDPAFEDPEVTEFHVIVDNIVTKTQIAYAGRISKITKKDAGCGNGKTTKTIPMSEKYWDPTPAKIWLTQCADDLEQTYFTWAMNTGIKRKDLTDTTFATFALELMTSAAKEDLIRFAWFGDTEIDEVAEGGTLGDAADIAYYDIINGFWKQIFAGVAANKTVHITIDENAEANYNDQDNLAADAAYKIFKGLMEKADKRLIGQPGKTIICTDSLFQNWLAYKESKNLDLSFVRMDKYFSTDIYRGVKIVSFHAWDRHIRSDFDNGTKYNLPHRAILVDKPNLKIGIDSGVGGITDFEVFYDKVTELNHFKGGYKVDVKLIHEFMVAAAY